MSSAPAAEMPKKKEDIGDEESMMECGICLDTLKGPVKLPCKHNFCTDCFEKWRSKYDSEQMRCCPECRKSIPPSVEMKEQLKVFSEKRDFFKEAMVEPYLLLEDYPTPLIFEGAPPDYLMYVKSLKTREDRIEVSKRVALQKLEEMNEEVKKLEAYFEEHGWTTLEDLNPHTLGKTIDLPDDIYQAVSSDDFEKVFQWLGVDPNNLEAAFESPPPKERINARNPDNLGKSLLHAATYQSNITLMSTLLRLGANVNSKTCFGLSPFRVALSAADDGNEDPARFLLEWGATEAFGFSPSQVAMLPDLLNLAQNTPLGGRRCEISGLQSRPDLNGLTGVAFKFLPDKDRYAVQIESTQEQVLIKSSNLTRRDRTPVDPGVSLILDKYKKKVEAKDQETKKLKELCNQLGQCSDTGDATIVIPDDVHDAAGKKGGIHVVLQWLGVDPYNLEASFDSPPPKERINAVNPDFFNRTLLHEAEFANQAYLMSLLLQLGAYVDPKSSSGQTPLGQALTEGVDCEDAARLLLEWGADIQACFRDDTAVAAAQRAGNSAMANLLQTPLGGRRCEISGLQKRPDLNGLTGVAYKYLPDVDRYAVCIETTKEEFNVKSCNLTRRDRTPADPGVRMIPFLYRKRK